MTALDAVYPVFILENDDFSFRAFFSADELRFCEKEDVLCGLFTGWDSRGHRLTILWDEVQDEPVPIADEGDSLDSFSVAVDKYSELCELAGINFSPGASHHSTSLCHSSIMRERIRRIKEWKARHR